MATTQDQYLQPLATHLITLKTALDEDLAFRSLNERAALKAALAELLLRDPDVQRAVTAASTLIFFRDGDVEYLCVALTNKCGGVTGLRGGQELEYRRRQPRTVSARRNIVTEEKRPLSFFQRSLRSVMRHAEQLEIGEVCMALFLVVLLAIALVSVLAGKYKQRLEAVA